MARVEPIDRADLRLEKQRADETDPRNGGQLLGKCIAARSPFDRRIEPLTFRRQGIMEHEESFGLRTKHRRERRRGQPRAATLPRQIGGRREQGLCREMAVNAILDPRALPHEKRAPAQQLPALARLEIRDPDRRTQMHAEQFGELARINRIRRRARLPDQRHMKGMRHAHRRALRAQLRHEPMPIQRRLHSHGHGAGQRAQPRPHHLDGRGELPNLGDDPAGVIEGAGGDVALV